MKKPLSYFLLFNFTVIVPHPSAWYPLNGTYNTSEIENRTTSGSRKDKVYLSLGPDGARDGSYFFQGSQSSSITFSNDNLDISGSITILCWVYTYNYEKNADTIFLQYKDTKLSAHGKTLTMNYSKIRGPSLKGTLAEIGWTFVGVSYNDKSVAAQLWIDGNMVNSKGLPAKLDPKGSQCLTLGGNNFKGKISQLMLFNLTLTQEQVQGIKGKIKLPGEMESYIAKVSTTSFHYQKAYIILK